MCGIAGIVRVDGRPVFEREVRAMCGAMTHRGPDDEGVYLSEGVGLGMRRLSIIDLENGQQPVSNEDGTIWVVFNGEIYNYRELRGLLTRRGHVFHTESDTETIVHLYEDFGAKAVGYLCGMFAFAIWDERRRQLLLARDRLGIKPLYYAQINGDLVFASELKPILQLPEVKRNLNWEGVSHLFTFLATAPSHSIVEGVRKLEPARIAVAAPGRPIRIERVLGPRVRARRARDGAGARRPAASAPGGVRGAAPDQRRADWRLPERRHRLERRCRRHGAALAGPREDVFSRLRGERVRRAVPCAPRREGIRHRASRARPQAGRRAGDRRSRVVPRRAVRRHVGDRHLHRVEAGGRTRQGRAHR